MRVTTWNVNGLRAAIRKGFRDHLERIAPDVLLLQEIRVLPEQLDAEWQDPAGWDVVWHPAQKKGYSGTAIWSRLPISQTSTGIGSSQDSEGRVVTATISDVQISSVYLPSGSSSPERQVVKNNWLEDFFTWTRSRSEATPVLFGGDLNIAHTKKDIFHWKSNQKTSGFLPHEREWFTNLLQSGWHDLVRQHFGDVDGPYSWWSNRGRARELDRGWRIDYLLGNKAIQKRFVRAEIDRDAGLAVSDHAPVTIEIE